MPKLFMTSALALALVAGPALAQTATERSSTTISPGSSSVEKSEKRTDGMGTTLEKNESSKSNALGYSSEQEQKVQRSDGSSESVKRERSSDPTGSSTSTTKTINR